MMIAMNFAVEARDGDGQAIAKEGAWSRDSEMQRAKPS